MKLFSKTTEYAILAMMHVIETDTAEGFSPHEVLNAAGIPEALGKKALGQLARSHILKGTPGPGGGYKVVPQLSDISLLDIVKAVDGERTFDECPLGVTCDEQSDEKGNYPCESCSLWNPHCGLGHMCPLHGIWNQVKHLVVTQLGAATLEVIRVKMERKGQQQVIDLPSTAGKGVDSPSVNP